MTEPRSNAPGALAVGIFVAYVGVLLVVMVTQGVEPLPDRFAVVMLVGAVILGRGKRFIADWSPFVFLVVSYDFLRGLAPALSGRAHFLASIDIDRGIFGVVPTVALQGLLFTGTPRWYDYFATFVYFLHFVVPLGFAMILWLRDRGYFAEFVASITLLSYAAWVTYVVFPAAPPWMAAQAGHLTGVTRILDKTIDLLPHRLDLPSVYKALDPNPVAAIPSIHAAYPFLVLLFALRVFGRRSLFVALYVAAVWWAIVYLGEHYATDVIIGVAYATAAFAAGPAVVRALGRLRAPRAVTQLSALRYRWSLPRRIGM
ncbi:MAG: inositol phosphorylceramide synthase [Chloroflexota bacterium]|nr:inositol phosphorylceramide synthase [Chloroflexota bacterium]MDE3192441.1 inositol phosphorylceramide synthase [Chloroflexota bacterium]